MSALDDIDYESYYEWENDRRRDYEDAKNMDILDLAKFILENIDYISSDYRKMNRDIANKVLQGKLITHKQRNCLNNAYAFMEHDWSEGWE